MTTENESKRCILCGEVIQETDEENKTDLCFVCGE